jgi:hypothetical protein
MTMKNALRPFAFLLILIYLSGCDKKEDSPTITKKLSEVKIGSAGGNIATSSGSVSAVVPPGALSTDTVIKIETTTEVAPAGVGVVQKLSPEGIQFQKPITLIFKYDEAELTQKKTYPELLRIVTREKGKDWEILNQVKLDKANKTISVETTHFSDWSVVVVKGNISYVLVTLDGLATPSYYSAETIVFSEKIDTLKGRKSEMDTSTNYVYGSYYSTALKTQNEDIGSISLYLGTKEEVATKIYDAGYLTYMNPYGYVLARSGLYIVVRKSTLGPVDYSCGDNYPPCQLTITNWGKNVGDLIAGTFSGRLYFDGKTQEDISGTFAFVRK